MKVQFAWVGVIATLFMSISTLFIACNKDDMNSVVNYRGQVVYINTTTPFADLTVKVTDGQNTHCQTLTDAGGNFTVKVRVDEIDGNYYLLAGDSTCIPKKVALGSYGQAEVDLGVIEVEGPTLPTITTKPITEISDNKATSGGNVTTDGRASVTARGVCWSQSEYPTIDDEYTINGFGVGEFKSQITNLEPGATYYVRAYATNRIGTAYGEQLILSSKTGLPQVTTDDVSNISATTATCGGEVAANSGYAITARGICWSNTTASPTVNNDHTEEVATTGHFSSMMIGLERNTTYYVRAYAVNEKGTNYGETKIFTTLSGLPTVTTSEMTEIKASTALGGGDVTNNGGYPIIARGVCWSMTSSTPTIEDNHTTEVADNGAFSSLITNLETNTTYYLRAYATNEIGTSYGESVTFTTANGLPVVHTTAVGDNITSGSITTGGNVADDGGFTIIARGVVYGTVPYPTIDKNDYTNDGTGIGYFGSSITNINVSLNTYYIRAYATNEKGTSYGEQEIVTPEKYDYCNLKTMVYGGYTYKIKPLGGMAWQEGNDACKNMVYGGYSDWFMPDKGEVQAILQAYNVWNVYVSYSSGAISKMQDIWTSTFMEKYYHSGTGSYMDAYYYYAIYTPTGNADYYSKWGLNTTANPYGTYNATIGFIHGVIAVRKYRAENQ